MQSDKISIIVPSMFRPNQFRECIKRVQETTQEFDVEIIAVVDGRCESTLYEAMMLPILTVYNEKHLGAIKSWNHGLRLSLGDIIVAIGDDCFCWDHWLEEALVALKTLPNRSGVVGLNAVYDDGHRTNRHCSHFLTTRQCIKEVLGGVLFYESYHHFFSDNETLQRAKRVGQYVAADKAKVEHRHFRLNKAPNDFVYELPLKWVEEDKALFEKREKLGFPNDFEAIIK